MISIEKIKYQSRWDKGCFIAYDPKTGKVLAEAKTLGDSTSMDGVVTKGLTTICFEKGYKGYIIHNFVRKEAVSPKKKKFSIWPFNKK